MKKSAVLVGNCQMGGLRECLKYTNFYDKYTAKQYANWEMIEQESAPPIKELKTADLVIYQPLTDVHGCFSTNPKNPDNMLNNCKADAIVVSMPRMYNNSLWPIIQKHAKKHIFFGCEKIPKDNSIREILDMYDAGILNFDFEERYKRNKSISLSKESETDIKVWDYIEDNITKKQLFLTDNHPTTDLFVHATRQVCDIIDIEFPKCILYEDNIAGLPDSTYGNPSCRYPYSTYSKQYFGFNWTASEDAGFYRNILAEYLNTRSL
jgi:hypothetical protein